MFVDKRSSKLHVPPPLRFIFSSAIIQRLKSLFQIFHVHIWSTAGVCNFNWCSKVIGHIVIRFGIIVSSRQMQLVVSSVSSQFFRQSLLLTRSLVTSFWGTKECLALLPCRDVALCLLGHSLSVQTTGFR